MSISHHLGDCSLFLITGPKILPPPPPSPRPTLIPGRVFSKSNPWVQGKSPTENEIYWLNTFWAMLLTDTHTDTQSDCKKPLAGLINAWRQCDKAIFFGGGGDAGGGGTSLSYFKLIFGSVDDWALQWVVCNSSVQYRIYWLDFIKLDLCENKTTTYSIENSDRSSKHKMCHGGSFSAHIGYFLSLICDSH